MYVEKRKGNIEKLYLSGTKKFMPRISNMGCLIKISMWFLLTWRKHMIPREVMWYLEKEWSSTKVYQVD